LVAKNTLIIPLLLFLVLPVLLFPRQNIKLSDSTDLKLEIDFRGYAINDQRIYWSGLEFSFGAEASIRALIKKRFKGGFVFVENEFFITQPFGENILVDENREDYLANFQIDPFSISRLNIGIQIGNFSCRLGKALSPFGRTHFYSFSNNLNFGSPFIRSEAILWRETGIFLHYKLAFLSFDVAAVNGEENRDTNSGKAGIFRLGAEGKNWAIGVSHKVHDGFGSEWQKIYKGHTGFDFFLKIKKFSVSGEYIYDKYGFHRPFDEEDIFWSRSLYFRDIFYAYDTPITGKGGYINLMYESEQMIINLNYGEYYPQEIGHPLHDPPIKRLVIKLAYTFAKKVRIYLSGLIENQREEESWSSGAKPFAGLVGVEYKL
jgi:hypothetical protein